jgi:hypothetical protein
VSCNFAPRELPRFLANTPPSNSRSGRAAVMDSRPPLIRTPCLGVRPPDRVSRVPRSICRRPPSPTTPESPTAASARCSAVGVRLHLLWEDGHSHLRIEAEPGSRSRITADAFAFPGSDGEVARAAAGSASW